MNQPVRAWRNRRAKRTGIFDEELQQLRSVFNRRLQRLHGLLRQQAVQLENQAQQLAELRGEPSLPPLGDFERWMESPATIPLAGKHIAWLAGKGLLAADEDVGKVLDQIDALPERQEVILGFVPNGAV